MSFRKSCLPSRPTRLHPFASFTILTSIRASEHATPSTWSFCSHSLFFLVLTQSGLLLGIHSIESLLSTVFIFWGGGDYLEEAALEHAPEQLAVKSVRAFPPPCQNLLLGSYFDEVPSFYRWHPWLNSCNSPSIRTCLHVTAIAFVPIRMPLCFFHTFGFADLEVDRG